MRLDQNPVHRKIITLWYDSEPVCFVMIVAVSGVFLFGMLGIGVTRTTPLYRDFVWVPVLLIAMSVTVLLSVTARLVLRYFQRYYH